MLKYSTSETCAPYSVIRHSKKKGTKAKYYGNLAQTPYPSYLPLGGTWKGTRHRIVPWAAEGLYVMWRFELVSQELQGHGSTLRRVSEVSIGFSQR